MTFKVLGWDPMPTLPLGTGYVACRMDSKEVDSQRAAIGDKWREIKKHAKDSNELFCLQKVMIAGLLAFAGLMYLIYKRNVRPIPADSIIQLSSTAQTIAKIPLPISIFSLSGSVIILFYYFYSRRNKAFENDRLLDELQRCQNFNDHLNQGDKEAVARTRYLVSGNL